MIKRNSKKTTKKVDHQKQNIVAKDIAKKEQKSAAKADKKEQRTAAKVLKKEQKKAAKIPVYKQLPAIMIRLTIAWLFAISITSMTLVLSDIEFRLIEQAVASAAVLLVLLLTTWFWQAVAVLAGAALISGLIIWFLQLPVVVAFNFYFEYPAFWLEEAFYWLISQPNVFPVETLPVLGLLLGMLISMGCYWLIARTIQPWLMFLAAAGLTIAHQSLGKSTPIPALLCSMLLVIIAMAIKQPYWGRKIRPRLITIQIRIFKYAAIPAACAVIIAGLLSSMIPVESFVTAKRPYVLEDLASLFVIPGITPTEPAPEFSINSAGYYPINNQLGGPVQLSNEPVMAITGSPQSMLLKGAVSDIYNGYSWYRMPMQENYRYDSPLWYDLQRKVFDQDMPVYESTILEPYSAQISENSEIPVLEGWYSEDLYYQVSPVSIGIRSIFLAGKPADIEMHQTELETFLPPEAEETFFDFARFDEALFFNMGGALYRMRSFASGQSYNVSSTRISINQQDFAAWYENTNPSVLSGEGFNPEEIIANNVNVDMNYLQIPDLPEYQTGGQLDMLVQEIINDQTNQYDKAMAIRNYLYNNYTYSLDVEVPPADREFVTWFLDQGEGYCVYFGTALAMMCRMAGIPARYVEGYAVPAGPNNNLNNESIQDSTEPFQDQDNNAEEAASDVSSGEDSAESPDINSNNIGNINQRIITGRQAHAWTEIYINGIGWISIDATPGGGSAAENYLSPDEPGSPDQDDPEQDDPEDEDPDNKDENDPEDDTESEDQQTGADEQDKLETRIKNTISELVTTGKIIILLLVLLLIAALLAAIIIISRKIAKFKQIQNQEWWINQEGNATQRISKLLPYIIKLAKYHKLDWEQGLTWNSYAIKLSETLEKYIEKAELEQACIYINEALYSKHQLTEQQWQTVWAVFSRMFDHRIKTKPSILWKVRLILGI